jgi:hypothetical protein
VVLLPTVFHLYTCDAFVQAKESGDNAMKGGFKGRKKLRGHFGKVYAMHWAGDAERVVRTPE